MHESSKVLKMIENAKQVANGREVGEITVVLEDRVDREEFLELFIELSQNSNLKNAKVKIKRGKENYIEDMEVEE